MTFLYWARYGFLSLMALAVVLLAYAHLKNLRLR